MYPMLIKGSCEFDKKHLPGMHTSIENNNKQGCLGRRVLSRLVHFSFLLEQVIIEEGSEFTSYSLLSLSFDGT